MSHEPRELRELRFTAAVHAILQRGGKCLIPVFALGRSQELLLILDDHWKKHPELHAVPIYYASTVAKKRDAHAAEPSTLTLDPHPNPRPHPNPNPSQP